MDAVKRDAYQLHADIERSMWNMPQISDWTDSYREEKRIKLYNIILALLCAETELHYYQGFHDIVTVLYLVLEDDQLAFALARPISKLFLADYMRKDFEIVSQFMSIVMTIIKLHDRQLYDYLEAASLEPYFATSWLITWFSHDDRNLESISRIFDVLLSSHPAYCFYLSAAYVISIRDSIFQVDCEFGELHNFLVHAPRTHGFHWDDCVQQADSLFISIPIHKLITRCDEAVWDLIKQNKVP